MVQPATVQVVGKGIDVRDALLIDGAKFTSWFPSRTRRLTPRSASHARSLPTASAVRGQARDDSRKSPATIRREGIDRPTKAVRSITVSFRECAVTYSNKTHRCASR